MERRFQTDEQRRQSAERHRRWYEINKERIRLANLEWRMADPDRHKAHRAVWRAITSGKMTRKPCEVCGSEIRVEAHHDDYTKRLDVRWLCRTHHKQHHADLKKEN